MIIVDKFISENQIILCEKSIYDLLNESNILLNEESSKNFIKIIFDKIKTLIKTCIKNLKRIIQSVFDKIRKSDKIKSKSNSEYVTYYPINFDFDFNEYVNICNNIIDKWKLSTEILTNYVEEYKQTLDTYSIQNFENLSNDIQKEYDEISAKIKKYNNDDKDIYDEIIDLDSEKIQIKIADIEAFKNKIEGIYKSFDKTVDSCGSSLHRIITTFDISVKARANCEYRFDDSKAYIVNILKKLSDIMNKYYKLTWDYISDFTINIKLVIGSLTDAINK